MPYDHTGPATLEMKVRADLFSAVRHAQDNGKTAAYCREYLRGVFVEPMGERGVTLVATNGHILLAAHDESGFANRPAILKTVFTAVQLRGMCKDRHPVTGVPLPALDAARCEEIHGTYPNWRRILPKLPEGDAPAAPSGMKLDLDYLALFQKAARCLGGSAAGGVQFTQTDPRGPAVVTFETSREMFGVIMPKGHVTSVEMPDWARS